MVINKDGPFTGLNKADNDKLTEFWFDEEAEREFMEIALIVYGEVIRINNEKGRNTRN
jgi:hypothetical protein